LPSCWVLRSSARITRSTVRSPAQIFLVLQPELEQLGIATPRRLLRASRG
jgi:hypothetical protein